MRWIEEGYEYEADTKHRKDILEMTGLGEESKGVVGAAVKEKGDEGEDAEELMDEDKTEYRGAAAKLNYLGLDRSDIQYAVKEICQGMSKPTVGGRKRIKRVARYLVEAGRVVWTFGEMEEEKLWVDVLVDSDWAGDVETRRSTSGGLALVGGVAVKHWSRTQKGRSLSSSEAEYYAIVTGSAEGIGIQASARELGWESKVRIWTDYSGAKSMALRRGLGKMRHIELKFLWVQEAIEKGRVQMKKIWGKVNLADHLTKPQGRGEYEHLLHRWAQK